MDQSFRWRLAQLGIEEIGAAAPIPRCQICARVLDPIECDVCDDCESKVV